MDINKYYLHLGKDTIEIAVVTLCQTTDIRFGCRVAFGKNFPTHKTHANPMGVRECGIDSVFRFQAGKDAGSNIFRP
jgi:hypothetical protein